ncbi:MAG: protein kinase domain-containing protein, partial [Gemmatimonadales bacterium]
MADSLTRLRRALAGRYTVERELGRGGMAVVYLAQDQKHHRRVAVKILRPELAAGLGPDRFLREIQIGAGLSHPHILPLFDSGEAGGSLYYVMPYVEGESLRDRLVREGPLPLADALRIADQVASALAYAHGRGVVHRDVKPENILLSGGEAVVADFGIARAISAAGGDHLTQTGIAMGTPAYMSPEQALGSGEVDGRSDIYSLGCVLYEMLVGAPPFRGATAQAVLAGHFATPAPSVRGTRDAVPEAVERAIMAALAKDPADRFATAADLAAALAGTGPVPAAPGRLTRLVSRRAPRVAAGMVLALVVAAALVMWPRQPGLANPAVVAVVPFRVAGADPTLRYLREGMMDLLATTLTGEGGPRAADPRTVMSAWRRAAGSEEGDLSQDATLRLARGLGAGRALLGAVVGTPARLVLNATLVSVPGGDVRAQASVEGPVDSLTELVGALAAQLLALGAGETRQRLALATSTSLPALRSYLDGRVAHRRGRYQEAVDHYRRALQDDSTFALAALGLRSAGAWIGTDVQRGVALAWALRERLSTKDRALLVGLVGPRYPANSSEREVLDAWDRAVAAAPDEPDAWYELGDQLFHGGHQIDANDAEQRAAAAFGRAVELDSSFGAPLGHLVELAARMGDAPAVRRLADLYFRTGPAPEVADYIRWRVAIALDDRSALASIHGRLPQLSGESLRRMLVSSQLDGIAWQDSERAAALWLEASGSPLQRWFALLRTHDFHVNRGDPDAALATTDSLAAARPTSRAYLRLRIEDALYAEGSTAAAENAARVLARFADAPLAEDGDERAEQYADLCTLTQWRLWRE